MTTLFKLEFSKDWSPKNIPNVFIPLLPGEEPDSWIFDKDRSIEGVLETAVGCINAHFQDREIENWPIWKDNLDPQVLKWSANETNVPVGSKDFDGGNRLGVFPAGWLLIPALTGVQTARFIIAEKFYEIWERARMFEVHNVRAKSADERNLPNTWTNFLEALLNWCKWFPDDKRCVIAADVLRYLWRCFSVAEVFFWRKYPEAVPTFKGMLKIYDMVKCIHFMPTDRELRVFWWMHIDMAEREFEGQPFIEAVLQGYKDRMVHPNDPNCDYVNLTFLAAAAGLHKSASSVRFLNDRVKFCKKYGIPKENKGLRWQWT